ncbi:hypothetical protein JYU34_007498 [Plutella xylostella]|uniref:Uncharacterized protein n=1 Tax=Plutella xylostella TaxID=51655 RepID=A0ABQ7QQJ4_PLUXY|nr:hypothetical protein JYU34_007498 [Plutella xylostella]
MKSQGKSFRSATCSDESEVMRGGGSTGGAEGAGVLHRCGAAPSRAPALPAPRPSFFQHIYRWNRHRIDQTNHSRTKENIIIACTGYKLQAGHPIRATLDVCPPRSPETAKWPPTERAWIVEHQPTYIPTHRVNTLVNDG